MRKCVSIVLLVILAACVKTGTVTFDPMVAETLPREVAVDELMSYSEATSANDEFACTFDEVGVRHVDGGEVVPYEQTYFYDANKAYTPVDLHPHLYVVKKAGGVALCDTMLSVGNGMGLDGQYIYEQKMKWLGTALLSLGSEYRPEGR